MKAPTTTRNGFMAEIKEYEGVKAAGKSSHMPGTAGFAMKWILSKGETRVWGEQHSMPPFNKEEAQGCCNPDSDAPGEI